MIRHNLNAVNQIEHEGNSVRLFSNQSLESPISANVVTTHSRTKGQHRHLIISTHFNSKYHQPHWHTSTGDRYSNKNNKLIRCSNTHRPNTRKPSIFFPNPAPRRRSTNPPWLVRYGRESQRPNRFLEWFQSELISQRSNSIPTTTQNHPPPLPTITIRKT